MKKFRYVHLSFFKFSDFLHGKLDKFVLKKSGAFCKKSWTFQVLLEENQLQETEKRYPWRRIVTSQGFGILFEKSKIISTCYLLLSKLLLSILVQKIIHISQSWIKCSVITRRPATTGVFWALQFLQRCFVEGWQQFFRMHYLTSRNFLTFANIKFFRFFPKKPILAEKKDIFKKFFYTNFTENSPPLANLKKKSHFFSRKPKFFYTYWKNLLFQLYSTASEFAIIWWKFSNSESSGFCPFCPDNWQVT